MPATTSRPLLPSRQFSAGPGAALVGALLLAAAASGCGPSDDKFPPACPMLSLLRDGGDLTRFVPGGGAVTDMVLHARIVGVPAKCQSVDAHHVKATLSVQAEMARGPAARERSLQATYFVALTEGDSVVQEQDFTLAGAFPANVDRISAKSDDIELLLPVTKTKTAAAYHIYVGFRLTPDELAYNRAHPTP
jgi:hypothetical protein